LPSQKIFATPQDAEAAFYEALERCDADAMMDVWAEEDEVTCIHPGGPRLVGHATIREAWRAIFANGMRLKLRLSQATTLSTPFAVVNTVLEHFSTPNDQAVRRTGRRHQCLCAWRNRLEDGGAPCLGGAAEQPGDDSRILH
jgi:hypothetical protein